jgi:hypothetical protein
MMSEAGGHGKPGPAESQGNRILQIGLFGTLSRTLI